MPCHQRTCARTASWGCTAGLRYAVPCETLDQMVLLRTVLNFSVLTIFLVFGLSGFPSERVAPRRFFQCSLSNTAFCVFVFFVKSNHVAIYSCCKHLAVVSNEKKRYHNLLFSKVDNKFTWHQFFASPPGGDAEKMSLGNYVLIVHLFSINFCKWC